MWNVETSELPQAKIYFPFKTFSRSENLEKKKNLNLVPAIASLGAKKVGYDARLPFIQKL